MRTQWIEFISARTARYLSPVGDVERRDDLDLSERAVDEFLERLRDDADLHLLALVYFLTQRRTSRFIGESLSVLLRSVSHATRPETELSLRGARGKILWPETRRRADSGRVPPGALVVRRAERSANVPENQLLKLLLAQVSGAVHGVSERVGTGRLLSELDGLRRRADLALNDAGMRMVTLPRRATVRMRQRAERSRNWRYAEAASLQLGFEAALQQGKWGTIIQLLQRGWLAPVSDDDLFELYVLVLLMDLLENEIGFDKPVAYGLLRRGRKQVADFKRRDGAEVQLFFDQSMSEVFAHQSRYKRLIRAYDGLIGQEHRPDLTMRIAIPGQPERRVLIEMKRSNDAAYRSESIYKCYGYLYDLAGLWNLRPQQRPKIILMFPTNIRRQAGTSDGDSDLAVCAADDRKRMSELVASVFSD